MATYSSLGFHVYVVFTLFTRFDLLSNRELVRGSISNSLQVSFLCHVNHFLALDVHLQLWFVNLSLADLGKVLRLISLALQLGGVYPHNQ